MTWKTAKLKRELLKLLAPGPERGGVILDDGAIFELTNISEEPGTSCILDLIPLVPVVDRMVATWHTHPDATADLSGMDWDSFTQWPACAHAIIGTDGVKWYRVKGLAVLRA
jgi:proteasome lid subunit RPN8/RPN11